MGNPVTNHERFGELSALAIIGQVSPEEYRELKAHLESCATCRQEHDALARILLTELPLAHEEKDSDLESLIAAPPAETSLRGHGSTGFASFDPSARNTRWASDSLAKLQRLRVPAVQAYAAIFLLFLTVGALGIRVARESQLDKLRFGQVATLREEIVGLRNQIHDLDKGAQNSYSAGRSIPAMTNDHDTRGSELDYGRLLARSREVESQLRTAREEIAILKQEASSGADRESQLSARLSETQGTLDKLSAELKTVRESHAQDASVIARQESQLLEAEEKLAAAMNAMDRDRKLLVADRDIRDLMGARNLRIIDVFDVDGKGKTRKPFGRVFFTEGKSLIFYAFDLGNDRPGLQSAAYQAWGSEGSFEHGVRSLGIFYRDDQKTNRWVLKFDDPDVLAEIDSVFVTTEPTGGSKKPTGGRLLAAYVKASLNHP
jgi:hypothetical protein